MYVHSAAYRSSFNNSLHFKKGFCFTLVAEIRSGMQSNPSSGTRPLARGGVCLWINVEIACEPSKWSIKATVDGTAWGLWDATVALARVGREGREVPGVYLCECTKYIEENSIMFSTCYLTGSFVNCYRQP